VYFLVQLLKNILAAELGRNVIVETANFGGFETLVAFRNSNLALIEKRLGVPP
jgi:hypothetical protein